MLDDSFLDSIRQACTENGVSLPELIKTLNEARTQAEIFSKQGDVLPDHSTRIKATVELAKLLQLSMLGKAAAFDLLQGKGAAKSNLGEVVRRRMITIKPEPQVPELPQ